MSITKINISYYILDYLNLNLSSEVVIILSSLEFE